MKRSFNDNIHLFLKSLRQFNGRFESADCIWDLIIPNKKKWYTIRVTRYKEDFYISDIGGNLNSLQVTAQKKIEIVSSFASFNSRNDQDPNVWNDIIIAAMDWLPIVKKDWINANKKVHQGYPLNCRYGIVSNALIQAFLPDVYCIDQALGKAKTKTFINLVKSGYFRDNKKIIRDSMTLNDFFNYCKIAYLAGQRKDEKIDANLTGHEMYERYADGRDNGLLEIDANSKQEFADWIDGNHPKKSVGGHPWEIKRGGNTTHIDLYVSRPSYATKEGFVITLCGRAMTRLKETICMFLAIYEAGLPITIDDPEGICLRLKAQDNIGLVPCFDSLHRANQRFPRDQHVYDVLHFDDLGRNKIKVKPFITWEPLPILKSIL